MAAAGRVLADNRRRFRWVAVFGVLAIAVWFLLEALENAVERAERQSVKLMLNQVRSALVVRGAEARLVTDETLETLQGLNPLSLLKTGDGKPWPQTDCMALALDEPGWCFDSDNRWLVYQPAQPMEVQGRRREPGDRFVWQVQVEYARTVKNGKSREKRATGLKLTEIGPNLVGERH